MKYTLILLLLLNLSLTAIALPQKVYLPVPFLCQAPQGDWSQPWQDACEEASILMAVGFHNGKQEILNLVNFQVKNMGGHFDLNAKQVAQLIKAYYIYNNVKVCEDVSIADIKEELAKGNLIIAPLAGRLLNNPYFTPPGPVYHMVLVKGYDDRTGEFITNDPGTRRGRNFRYNYDVFYNALHDWLGNKQDMLQSKKAIVVVESKVYE